MIFAYTCTDNDIRKCDEFSRKMTESKKTWNDRHSTPNERMHQATIIGKLGEIAVSNYLKSLGFDCNDPDFNIYQGKKKSYSADLQINGSLNIHVKTQDIKMREILGDSSWVFMNADPVTYRSSKDIVIFCVHNKNVIEITHCVRANELQENNLFRATHNQNNDLKCAVRSKDLRNIREVKFAA